METVEDFLNFCNAAVFCDFKNVGVICELNQVRKCIINSFYKTFPYTRILVSLSIIDDIFFKTYGNENEKILENIHDLREEIIYMLSFEKVCKDEDDDDDDE